MDDSPNANRLHRNDRLEGFQRHIEDRPTKALSHTYGKTSLSQDYQFDISGISFLMPSGSNEKSICEMKGWDFYFRQDRV